MDYCGPTQIILLIEYLQRTIDEKLREHNIDKQIIKEINEEIEQIKQILIEQGITRLMKELGI